MEVGMAVEEKIALWIFSCWGLCWVIWVLVRSAVKQGNRETQRQLNILIKLKKEELRRRGMDEEEIEELCTENE
jgi:hypothetical protein